MIQRMVGDAVTSPFLFMMSFNTKLLIVLKSASKSIEISRTLITTPPNQMFVNTCAINVHNFKIIEGPIIQHGIVFFYQKLKSTNSCDNMRCYHEFRVHILTIICWFVFLRYNKILVIALLTFKSDCLLIMLQKASLWRFGLDIYGIFMLRSPSKQGLYNIVKE